MIEKASAVAEPGWVYTRRGYAIARCFGQLSEHKLASICTLMVLGITLALPVMLFFSSSTLQAFASRSMQGETISVFLAPEIDDLQGAELALSWQARADVLETDFIPKEEALRALEQNSQLSEAISALGTNPLPGTIVLYPDLTEHDSDQMQQLAEFISALPQVDKVQMDLQWVHRLQAIVTLVKWIGGLLALFLTLTALLVIANTIRLEMARRRSELAVARLLGASAGFTRFPVLLSGAVYGLIGGTLACIMAALAVLVIRQAINDLSSLYDSSFTMNLPTLSQIFIVLGGSMILGLIGAGSSIYRSTHELTLPDLKP
jgi:cell division transport system permease protein